MGGLRFSVLVPRRMWAIWLIEPMAGLRPRRAAMTPATKVEATAPMPGVSTPSVPVAGAICRGADSLEGPAVEPSWDES